VLDKQAAGRVSQDLLDVTGQAYLDGNAEAFVPHFDLPFLVETFEGEVTFETLQDMHAVFARMTHYYRTVRVIDIVRRCLSAESVSPDRILATHETRLVCVGNVLLNDPYTCLSELRRVDGVWKIGTQRYAMANAGKYSSALLGRSV
jgi:hypothetical protein